MKEKIFGWLLVVVALIFMGCTSSVSNPDKDNNPDEDTNADLTALTVSSGIMSPVFARGTTAYSVIVPNAVTSITITGTKADSSATLSDNNGVAQTLTEGTNTITLSVTTQDGTTVKNYVVTVVRFGTDYTSPTIGTLKYVPAGSFKRYRTPTDISRISTAFRVSQYEITREQFAAILGTDPSDVRYSSGTTDPVQMASWYQAIAFCNKLSLAERLTPVYTVTGVDFASLTYADIPTTWDTTWNTVTATLTNNGYRLPTHMEWMWAAIGATSDRTNGYTGIGTNTTGYKKAFAGSTGSNAIGDYAVFGYDESDIGRTTTKRTNPVGSKTAGANELGLYDMSGNVWEWTWDWQGDVPDGALLDYQGPAKSWSRVYCGGAWKGLLFSCNVDYSSARGPEFQSEDIGFRVVRP